MTSKKDIADMFALWGYDALKKGNERAFKYYRKQFMRYYYLMLVENELNHSYDESYFY